MTSNYTEKLGLWLGVHILESSSFAACELGVVTFPGVTNKDVSVYLHK